MDEGTSGSTTAGEQLKAAREAQGITLEDVAARTRIPTRHLESLEKSEWSRLPAPTYTIGFAKSYASVVGLDRNEIGEALRAELGHGALAARPEAQVFEPADPARVMPKWLVLIALLALVAVAAAFLWNRNRALDAPDSAVATEEASVAATPGPAASPAVQPAASPTGPVVITANEPAWIQVSERGGRTLFQAELAAGQSYEVPAAATAPVLRTGRPQSIRIAVGTADAPPVGQPDTTVSNVSLKAEDLLRGPSATPAAPTAAPAR
ncbi:helix-turn-helix domain-containing protein [Sphingomonas sp. LHG3406-1]|uniref:helix-turn-helix domain-containing protein n=1 Tax=Sphingomonas sp. LHG3406-1 TaxID=2804617 RepID=UPI002628D7F3|nr:helix-turn-helix domain-containing protein [Sphingomonas sp. LHG3406-1]